MVESFQTLFPGLANSAFHVTSAATKDYNCIAWAAGDSTHWWWPDPDPDNEAKYWPPEVALAESLDAFIAAFATLGYSPCPSEELEQGIEKIAFFAHGEIPTHAARQLPSGRWTSKLGMREDIEHDLHALGGDVYGKVVLILRRPMPAEAT